MRPFIKYISLLLFGGLILPFSFIGYPNKPASASTHVKQEIIEQPIGPQKPHPQYFSIQQIIEFVVPMLKY